MNGGGLLSKIEPGEGLPALYVLMSRELDRLIEAGWRITTGALRRRIAHDYRRWDELEAGAVRGYYRRELEVAAKEIGELVERLIG